MRCYGDACLAGGRAGGRVLPPPFLLSGEGSYVVATSPSRAPQGSPNAAALVLAGETVRCCRPEAHSGRRWAAPLRVWSTPASAEPTLPEGSVPGTRPTRWPDCGARVGGPGSCCSLHRGPGWPQGLVQVREVSLGPAHLMGDSGPALAPVPLTPRPLSHSWAIPGGAVAVATPTDGTRTGAAAPAVHG